METSGGPNPVMAPSYRMSAADTAWLRMDQPTNLMVITGVLWFDRQPDWDVVRERLRVRWVERYRPFRQRVVEGASPLSRPRWEDDPWFDLDRHIHRLALPAPGDRAALQSFVADRMASPLDRSKPLWDFYFVDGYEGGAALVGRVHHCIADGTALARLVLSLTDESADAGIDPVAEPTPTRTPERGRLSALLGPLSTSIGLARGATALIAQGVSEARRDPGLPFLAVESGRDGAEALARAMFGSSDPSTGLNGELGVTQRVAWSTPIPLEDVRAIGHLTAATVNDVLVAAVARAIGRYIEDRGGWAEELTTVVPLNLRPLDEPLPAELGNRFGLVFLRLPVGIKDQRRRLDEVHERMQRIKGSPAGAVSYAVLDAVGRMPAGIERRLVSLFTGKADAVTTNVPGPPRTVYLAGTPVRGLLVWAPRSGGVPISITIISYAGEVIVGVMSDAGLIPDPEAIVEAFERDLESFRSSSTLR